VSQLLCGKLAFLPSLQGFREGILQPFLGHQGIQDRVEGLLLLFVEGVDVAQLLHQGFVIGVHLFKHIFGPDQLGHLHPQGPGHFLQRRKGGIGLVVLDLGMQYGASGIPTGRLISWLGLMNLLLATYERLAGQIERIRDHHLTFVSSTNRDLLMY